VPIRAYDTFIDQFGPGARSQRNRPSPVTRHAGPNGVVPVFRPTEMATWTGVPEYAQSGLGPTTTANGCAIATDGPAQSAYE
jgi:hypothetical protein